jgi:hypothetical protein
VRGAIRVGDHHDSDAKLRLAAQGLVCPWFERLRGHFTFVYIIL